LETRKHPESPISSRGDDGVLLSGYGMPCSRLLSNQNPWDVFDRNAAKLSPGLSMTRTEVISVRVKEMYGFLSVERACIQLELLCVFKFW
jgi:hypothetical protein